MLLLGPLATGVAENTVILLPGTITITGQALLIPAAVDLVLDPGVITITGQTLTVNTGIGGGFGATGAYYYVAGPRRRRGRRP